MKQRQSRRDILKSTLALAGLGLAGLPDWVLPVMAQGETLVPFTDIPATANFVPAADRRLLDIRTVDGPFTPPSQWFTTQHYGHPTVDAATFRLKLTGLVDRPQSLTIDDLRKLGSGELIAGFECSGNRRPLQGLSSNGRWTGVPLKTVLDRAGVKAQAKQFVFFGADKGEEEIEWRNQKFNLEQQFGRSLDRDKALSGEPFLAYAMNGEPLTKHQGAPLRLIVPGWYGVANVKWLSHIHLQEDEYLGKYQARWYRSLKGEMIDGQLMWKEAAITRMQLKSYVARVTSDGRRHKVVGIILNDGTPIRGVEVKVDDGPWQPAVLDSATRSKYSWKLFSYEWNGATPGEHTVVSRVTDITGRVQPTLEDLENKKSFLEDNSQHPRKVMIA
ncbi:MAG: molybdopterin-dependent oxidoreductase [Vicinamibacterales bacterium]